MNRLRFTRISSDGVYYTDLKTSLRNSVKFDIFNADEHIATLITNNRKTISLSKDNTFLSIVRKWNLKNEWRFSVFKTDTILLASIYIYRPIVPKWVVPEVYSITFADTGLSYRLTRRKRRELEHALTVFQYDIIFKGAIKCSIINQMKPDSIFDFPTSTELAGVIEYDDRFTLEKILCVLQFVNIHIDLDFGA